MEFSGDYGVVLAEHLHCDVGEIELAHGFAGCVMRLVALENRRIAVLEGFSDEGCIGRVFVAVHEGVDVSAVPCGLLVCEDLLDGG